MAKTSTEIVVGEKSTVYRVCAKNIHTARRPYRFINSMVYVPIFVSSTTMNRSSVAPTKIYMANTILRTIMKKPLTKSQMELVPQVKSRTKNNQPKCFNYKNFVFKNVWSIVGLGNVNIQDISVIVPYQRHLWWAALRQAPASFPIWLRSVGQRITPKSNGNVADHW